MTELKSCIYCGSDGVRSGYADGVYYVKCDGCGRSVWSKDRTEAVEAWNQAIDDEVE